MVGARRGSRRGRGDPGAAGFREPSPYGGAAAPEPPGPAPVEKAPPAGRGADAGRAKSAGSGGELEAVRAERDALRERFDRLERVLADPDKGENAILYYRLRTVWNLCHQDLKTLAAESRRKFEVGDAGETPEPETGVRAELHENLAAARAEEKRLREEIARIRFALYEREKPFKTGEKRTLERGLDEATPRLVRTESRVRELEKKLSEHEASAPPERPASPARETQTARRAINTLLIALAQHYYLLFREDQVAEMSLQAARKPVDAVYFGLTSECLELNRKTRELMTRARTERNRPEAVRRRSRYLRSRLRYGSDTTAIPLAESLNWLPTRIAADSDLVSDADELLPVNVLSQNYWDLSELLLD